MFPGQPEVVHRPQDGAPLAGQAFELEGATLSTLMPTRFDPFDIGRASTFVYLMALVVGLYPALRVTRLLPAEALRRT